VPPVAEARRSVSAPPVEGTCLVMHVVALIGSLRKASYDRMTFNAVRELLPEGMTVDEGEIAAIPPYNDDVLEASGHPEPVRRLREQIRAADAVLFISPEYNYSIPGVLKNAIDWISRPVEDQPLRGKPVAIMGAAKRALGTGRMQYHLRQVFVFVEAIALVKPEVMINFEADKFVDGKLVDEPTRRQIRAQLEALQRWVERLQSDD
jgi:chromate reductase